MQCSAGLGFGLCLQAGGICGDCGVGVRDGGLYVMRLSAGKAEVIS